MAKCSEVLPYEAIAVFGAGSEEVRLSLGVRSPVVVGEGNTMKMHDGSWTLFFLVTIAADDCK